MCGEPPKPEMICPMPEKFTTKLGGSKSGCPAHRPRYEFVLLDVTKNLGAFGASRGARERRNANKTADTAKNQPKPSAKTRPPNSRAPFRNSPRSTKTRSTRSFPPRSKRSKRSDGHCRVASTSIARCRRGRAGRARGSSHFCAAGFSRRETPKFENFTDANRAAVRAENARLKAVRSSTLES